MKTKASKACTRTDEQKKTNKKPQEKSTNQHTQRALICLHLQNGKKLEKKKNAHCPHRHYHHRQQNCRQAQNQLKNPRPLSQLITTSINQSLSLSLLFPSLPIICVQSLDAKLGTCGYIMKNTSYMKLGRGSKRVPNICTIS